MFNKLLQKFLSLVDNYKPLDPSDFNDPIAMQTEWVPVKRGGANFKTHKLAIINSTRMEFKASLGTMLFFLFFLMFGGGIFLHFFVSIFRSFHAGIIVPILVSLIFVIVGGGIFYSSIIPIVFDKQIGYFWKGWKSPGTVFDTIKIESGGNTLWGQKMMDNLFNKKTSENVVELNKIHALQIISEYCRGNKSSYYSYELNIVLEDGKRINVIDHGNLNALRQDAATLSEFLSKPVWDTTRYET